MHCPFSHYASRRSTGDPCTAACYLDPAPPGVAGAAGWCRLIAPLLWLGPRQAYVAAERIQWLVLMEDLPVGRSRILANGAKGCHPCE